MGIRFLRILFLNNANVHIEFIENVVAKSTLYFLDRNTVYAECRSKSTAADDYVFPMDLKCEIEVSPRTRTETILMQMQMH